MSCLCRLRNFLNDQKDDNPLRQHTPADELTLAMSGAIAAPAREVSVSGEAMEEERANQVDNLIGGYILTMIQTVSYVGRLHMIPRELPSSTTPCCLVKACSFQLLIKT